MPDREKYEALNKMSDHKSINFLYQEIDTPHTLDPVRVKTTDDPDIYFQSFHDFVPDFYKVEFYDSHQSLPFGGPKIHSLTDDGYYYFDDHRHTDLRSFAHGHHTLLKPTGWHGYRHSFEDSDAGVAEVANQITQLLREDIDYWESS